MFTHKMNVLKKLKKIIKKGKYQGDVKFCPVCNKNNVMIAFPYNFYFNKFYENGFVYSPFLFETLNLKNYKCSNCLATDRERLIAIYLKKYLKNQNKNGVKLIDFAPSKGLQPFLKKLDIIYRSADLLRENVDDKVDITDMNIYKDEAFDIFICSHILEHVKHDIKAMEELYRITKPDGIGLCLVPLILSLDSSVENEEYLKSEHLRWKYFGQNDHVRMYSKKDFISRLQGVGFKVEQCGIDFFGKDVFDLNGLDVKSVLYVVKK